MAYCPILGNTCATLQQLITIIPDLKTFGGTSRGVIELTGPTLVGDTLVIGGKTLTAVAGLPAIDQWSIDGDEFSQLDSLLAAIVNPLGSFVTICTASLQTPGILKLDVNSINTGLYSSIPWSTTSLTIVLDPVDALSGGECDLEFFSSVACSQINSMCWGNKTTAAHIFLTAHLIDVGNNADVGVGTSKKIDKIQQGSTYVAPDPKDAYYANTKWGRLYKQLWATLPLLPLAATGAIPRRWPSYGRGRWRC